MIRAAFYLDGFNIYHSLDDLNRPHLKWLDWRALASRLVPSRDEIVCRIVYCSAQRTDKPDRLIRHRRYVSALEATGVVCKMGNFLTEKRICRSCGADWDAPVEKQSDVNLALALVQDGFDDVFDHAYLVTADTDQVPAVAVIKERFPMKKVTSVVVTGRRHNNALLTACGNSKRTITVADLEACLLPKLINGASAVLRPPEYDPPN